MTTIRSESGFSREPIAGSSPWTVRSAQNIERLRASTRIARDSPDLATSRHAEAAEAALDRAQELLAKFRKKRVLGRLISSSASHVAVLAEVQLAAEQVLYSQSDTELSSLVPELAGAVRNYLGSDDQRRETYLTYLRNLEVRALGLEVNGSANGGTGADLSPVPDPGAAEAAREEPADEPAADPEVSGQPGAEQTSTDQTVEQSPAQVDPESPVASAEGEQSAELPRGPRPRPGRYELGSPPKEAAPAEPEHPPDSAPDPTAVRPSGTQPAEEEDA